MRISFNIQTHCALILNLSRLFSIAAITPNIHYHIVYTYQLENRENWFFFLMAKIARAVWLHREVTIVVALISHFLPSNCLTQKGIENQTKVCLGAANKTYPTLAATTGSLLLLITLWHRHTNTHMQTQKWMAHQQTQQTQTDLAFFWHLPQ